MTAPEHRESALALAEGEVVAGRYRVLGAMGAGGMATVHRAQELSTGRLVALKVLRPELGKSSEAVERLRREAQILAHIRHPAIVEADQPGVLPSGQLYIAMELLEGETLGERLRGGRLDPAELAPIVAGVCAGLAAAHAQGVIHRDLKPDNIFLVRGSFGEPERVKLLDFGISKVLGFDRLTRTGQVLGTPRYMAPEQLLAERSLDGRVDVYALGVILYEALSGLPPFPATVPSALIVAILAGNAPPLRSLRPELPVELETLVARAMARAPEARFGSAEALGAAFAELALEAAPRGPRAPMRTTALGAMETPGLRSAAAAPPEFRAGTFSEFQVPEALLSPAPIASAAPPIASPQVVMATPPRAPSRRLLIAAIALCALLVVVMGAAAVAVWVHDARAPAPPPRLATAPRPAAPVHADVVSSADFMPIGAPPPVAIAVDAGAPETLVPTPPPSPRRQATRRSQPAAPPPFVYEGDAPDEGSPRTLLRAARAARDAGDIQGCIATARRAAAEGAGPLAELLLGDCYLRTGDQANAAKAYERFCHAAPDHPSVARISELVARFGGRCEPTSF